MPARLRPAWTLLLVWGCSNAPEDSALLAVVAGSPIRMEQLRQHQERLPPSLQMGAKGKDNRRDLQALIDRRLLDLEAESRGLSEDAQVMQKLRKKEETRLFEEMMQRQVDARLIVTEAEVQHEFEQGWSDQVETLEFFVADKEKVESVEALLDEGVEFTELGRSYSVDRKFKKLLGQLQSFTYSPFDRPREVVKAAFELPVGGVARTVPFLDGYVFAKVIARRKVTLETVQDQVAKAVEREKRQILRSIYLIDLRKRFNLTFHQEGMDLAVRGLLDLEAAKALTQAQRSAPVYSYDGGALDVKAVWRAVLNASAKWPDLQEGRVVNHLKEQALPRRLTVLDARAKEMDGGDEFQAWRQGILAELMVSQLRSIVLDENVNVTQEELTAYYRKNIARFTHPDRARVQEIVVADRELARQLKVRLEQGADMEALIGEHSMFPEPPDGKIRVAGPQVQYYGKQFVDAVMEAPLNQIQGPIRSREGFAVFRVYERYPAEAMPLEGGVLRKVEDQLVESGNRTAFTEFLKWLRQKYADRIEVYEERLEQRSEQQS